MMLILDIQGLSLRGIAHISAPGSVRIWQIAQALLEFENCGTPDPVGVPQGELPTLVASFDRGKSYVRVDPIDTLEESGLRSGMSVRALAERETRALRFLRERSYVCLAKTPGGQQAVFSLCEGENTVGSGQRERICLPEPLAAAQAGKVLLEITAEGAKVTARSLDPFEAPEVAHASASHPATLNLFTPCTLSIYPASSFFPNAASTPSMHSVPSGLATSSIPFGPATSSASLISATPATPSVPFAQKELRENIPRFRPRKYTVGTVKPKAFAFPRLPQPQMPQHLSWVSILMPAIIGIALFAFTRSPLTLLFVLGSPLIALGNWFDHRVRNRKKLSKHLQRFEEKMSSLQKECESALKEEMDAYQRKYPDAHELISAVFHQSPIIWSVQFPHPKHSPQLFLGFATVPTRITFEENSEVNEENECPQVEACRRSCEKLREESAQLERAPMGIDYEQLSHFGIVGSNVYRHSRAVQIAAQLACLISPQFFRCLIIVNQSHQQYWSWAQWFPHFRILFSQNSQEASMEKLCEILGEEIQKTSSFSRLYLVCEISSVPDMKTLYALLEETDTTQVHPIWLAAETADLPNKSNLWIEQIHEKEHTTANVGEFENENSLGFSRQLPFQIEADISRQEHSSYLRGEGEKQMLLTHSKPPSEQYLFEMAQILSHSACQESANLHNTLEWKIDFALLHSAEGSLHLQTIARNWNALQGLCSLATPIGKTKTGIYVLDLHAQGPHALVCGTTGSGKSEFLLTWMLSLAVSHPPSRINMLFIDFKGGATFAKLQYLPHSCGLVTDLSEDLADRVLVSLRAELRRREEVLADYAVSSLKELRKKYPQALMPQLIIVVDEFATLVEENPQFTSGIIDIAQRGRSLGVHMILATQQAGRAIGPAVRANTNVRIAFRTASAQESREIIDDSIAAEFSFETPGRAGVRVGNEEVQIMQSGYVNGTRVSDDFTIEWFTREFAGCGRISRELYAYPDEGNTGVRLVHTEEQKENEEENALETVIGLIRKTADLQKVPLAEKPWCEPLKNTIILEEYYKSLQEAGEKTAWVIGVMDEPQKQRQTPVYMNPLQSRTAVVIGGAQSGKTQTMKMFAKVAQNAARAECVRIGKQHQSEEETGVRSLAYENMASLTRLLWFCREEMRAVKPLTEDGNSEKGEQELLGEDSLPTDAGGTESLRAESLNLHVSEQSVSEEHISEGSISGQHVSSSHESTVPVLLLFDDIEEFYARAQKYAAYQWEEQLCELLADGAAKGIYVLAACARFSQIPPSARSLLHWKFVLAQTAEQELTYVHSGYPKIASHNKIPGRGFLAEQENKVIQLLSAENKNRERNEPLSATENKAVTAERVPKNAGNVSQNKSGQSQRGESRIVRWEQAEKKLRAQKTLIAHIFTGEEITLPPCGVWVVSGSDEEKRQELCNSILREEAEKEHDVARNETFDTSEKVPQENMTKSQRAKRTLEQVVQGLKTHRYTGVLELDTLHDPEVADLFCDHFAKLEQSEHLLIVHHDPTNTVLSWSVQKVLESARIKLSLTPSEKDPRNLIREPPCFPYEENRLQGAVEYGKKVFPVQYKMQKGKI